MWVLILLQYIIQITGIHRPRDHYHMRHDSIHHLSENPRSQIQSEGESPELIDLSIYCEPQKLLSSLVHRYMEICIQQVYRDCKVPYCD